MLRKLIFTGLFILGVFSLCERFDFEPQNRIFIENFIRNAKPATRGRFEPSESYYKEDNRNYRKTTIVIKGIKDLELLSKADAANAEVIQYVRRFAMGMDKFDQIPTWAEFVSKYASNYGAALKRLETCLKSVYEAIVEDFKKIKEIFFQEKRDMHLSDFQKGKQNFRFEYCHRYEDLFIIREVQAKAQIFRDDFEHRLFALPMESRFERYLNLFECLKRYHKFEFAHCNLSPESFYSVDDRLRDIIATGFIQAKKGQFCRTRDSIYASPEQYDLNKYEIENRALIENQKPNLKADVYSLGMIIISEEFKHSNLGLQIPQIDVDSNTTQQRITKIFEFVDNIPKSMKNIAEDARVIRELGSADRAHKVYDLFAANMQWMLNYEVSDRPLLETAYSRIWALYEMIKLAKITISDDEFDKKLDILMMFLLDYEESGKSKWDLPLMNPFSVAEPQVPNLKPEIQKISHPISSFGHKQQILPVPKQNLAGANPEIRLTVKEKTDDQLFTKNLNPEVIALEKKLNEQIFGAGKAEPKKLNPSSIFGIENEKTRVSYLGKYENQPPSHLFPPTLSPANQNSFFSNFQNENFARLAQPPQVKGGPSRNHQPIFKDYTVQVNPNRGYIAGMGNLPNKNTRNYLVMPFASSKPKNSVDPHLEYLLESPLLI